jgi:hypothetical protein
LCKAITWKASALYEYLDQQLQNYLLLSLRQPNNVYFESGHLLDIAGGVLFVDGLCRDGAAPADGLHDVGRQRRLNILAVVWREERRLGLLRSLLGETIISFNIFVSRDNLEDQLVNTIYHYFP